MNFNILDILNNATNIEARVEGYTEITIDYNKIKVTKYNKYSMGELEEMAAGIEMAGGLQQPCLLGRVNGEYWLCSGHRRHGALGILIAEGKTEYKEVPCIYKDMTELEFRINLLIGNTFNRQMTDYDKMIQAAEWKELLQQARAEGSFKPEKGKRTRDYIAKLMGENSPSVIGELERINNNGTDKLKEQFKEGNINKTTAAIISTLPDEEQDTIASSVAAGENIRVEEIKELARQQKEAQTTIDKRTESVENDIDEGKYEKAVLNQLQANVSDTDTKNNEKENTRKLHAIKMLEKYYIYLNDEETNILENMLEDCKRRKREYAFDDVDETKGGNKH